HRGSVPEPVATRTHFGRACPTAGERGRMIRREARCSCGPLTATCTGEPVRISIFHCLACPRRTRGPLAQQARWPTQNVQFEGRSTSYVRVGDEGGKATFHFCPVCGCTVTYDLDSMPGVVAVPVGAFADPGFPAPTVSVYESRKHSWVAVPKAIEHVD